MTDPIRLEIFRAGLGLVVSSLTLSIGWLVGQRLTVTWNIIQKRRETEIANVQQLYAVYGEFRELSKTWRLIKTYNSAAKVDQESCQWSLLTRACALESKLESINIKLATERFLQPDVLQTLGLFRQGIQRLRESIRDNVDVASSSRGVHYDHFNDLAARVAALISSNPKGPCPSAFRASVQLHTIAEVELTDFNNSLQAYKITRGSINRAPKPPALYESASADSSSAVRQA
ncbi:hypothetical protein [Granulicella sibirica]|uniref:hypothetical protein n=1 Tax=Granulicella sibirica TaxID=2479048 RepID=UPI0010087FA5|nr:hypothetical protein [Granulicella sibirica]